MYKLTDNPDLVVRLNQDGTSTTIPKSHRFWDEYQVWLDAGNTPEPLPTTVQPPIMVVTMRQARLALLQAGLLQTVNDAVASMPGAAGEDARIEWEYSQEVQRDKQLVLALAPVLGLSEAQLDALFVAAAAL